MSQLAKVDHAELVSQDPAATQKFLEKAFGLKFRLTGPETGNYRMHGREEGAGSATIGIRDPMGPENPGAVPYLTVPNLDSALKSVQSAGGKVVQPKTEIPGMAWIAVCVAPGGVALGLYQSK